MISVIVPTLNEETHLAETLRSLQANSTPHEIIVVDANSSDRTAAIASAQGARVLSGQEPSRALQMNAGAAVATGDLFLFLHADTRIGRCSLTRIEQALTDHAIVGGGFARRFDSNSLFLRCTCALATLRCSLFGLFLGDQGIFVRRDIFQQLGGFKPLRLFEDADFSRRLAGAGRTVTLFPPVVSSARRFEKRGPVLTTCRDLWLTAHYLLRSPGSGR